MPIWAGQARRGCRDPGGGKPALAARGAFSVVRFVPARRARRARRLGVVDDVAVAAGLANRRSRDRVLARAAARLDHHAVVVLVAHASVRARAARGVDAFALGRTYSGLIEQLGADEDAGIGSKRKCHTVGWATIDFSKAAIALYDGGGMEDLLLDGMDDDTAHWNIQLFHQRGEQIVGDRPQWLLAS